MLSIKDFNPFYKTEMGGYKKNELIQPEKSESYTTLEENIAQLPEDVSVYSYEYDEDLYIPIRISRESETVEQSFVEEPIKNTSTATGNLEFIVGCFGNETNAENLVQTLKGKGFNAYILDVKNGLSRISAGSASSDAEMSELMQNARSQGFDGWVLKK
jgi:cell division protein FtsN